MHDDFPILASVAVSPAHPYRLLEHLSQLGVKMTRSTLYRRVDALVATGLLEVTPEPGAKGHPRRSLGLTARGREALARDAQELLRRQPLESPLFALALNCADALEPGTLADILRVRMAGAARRLTEEERRLAAEPGERLATLGRERRVAHLRADVAWLQSVVGQRLAGAAKQERRAG